jgi:hypothetical protein
VLSQGYVGDVTIVPNISYGDYQSLMSNPTPESLVQARLRGERATWPSKVLVDIHRLIGELSIIHNHCAIELAIDNALYDLNVKMVFGNVPNLQRDSRRKSIPMLGSRYENPVYTSASMEMTPLDVAICSDM